MEGSLLAEDYDMTTFLSQLLQDPSRIPAYIWELEKLSTTCAQRIARLSKQTNSVMMEKLSSVSSLRSELTQRMRQLERIQLRLQKVQMRVAVPFQQVEEGTQKYEKLIEVGEKLRDLQSCLAKARRGDLKGVEELSKSFPSVDIVQQEISRLSSK